TVLFPDQEFLGTETIVTDDALFLAFDDLHLVGGHLLARFQTRQVDFAHGGLAQRHARDIGFRLAGDQAFGVVIGIANSRTRDIEGNVSAADDYHAASDEQPLSERHGAQEIDAAINTLCVRTRQLQHAPPLGAYRDDDGLEAPAEFFKVNVASYLYAAAELDAQPPDQFDLGVDEIARQAVRRYACIQHPGGPRFGFEDR